MNNSHTESQNNKQEIIPENQRHQTGRGIVSKHTHPKRSLWKRFYVSTLLILLPLILKIGTLLSKNIRSESDYLGPAFSFTLEVTGYQKKVSIQRNKRSWKKISSSKLSLSKSSASSSSSLPLSAPSASFSSSKPSLLPFSTSPASMLPSPAATTYTISFRDLDYAYDVFSGALTLKDALAARLFSTHGPNNLGVSLTYLFTIILKSFFFWRSAYHK